MHLRRVCVMLGGGGEKGAGGRTVHLKAGDNVCVIKCMCVSVNTVCMCVCVSTSVCEVSARHAGRGADIEDTPSLQLFLSVSISCVHTTIAQRHILMSAARVGLTN